MARTKSSASKKVEKIRGNKLYIKILRIALILVCSLVTYSLLVSSTTLQEDFNILHDMGLWDSFSAEAQPFSNPVGIFGAIFGFLVSISIGHYFAIALMLSLVAINFTKLFHKEDSVIVHNINLVMGLLFFVHLLFSHFYITSSKVLIGYVAYGIDTFLGKIIGSNGTVAFLLIIAILDILLIFGWEPVKQVFFSVMKTIFAPIFHKNKASKDKKSVEIEDDPDIKKDRRFSTDKKPSPTIANSRVDYLEAPTDKVDDADITDIIEQEASTPRGKKGDFNITEPEKTVLMKVKKSSPDHIQGADGKKAKYIKPDVNKFLEIENIPNDFDKKEIEKNIKQTSVILQNKLAEFGIEAEVVNVNIGPIITQYELKPASGVKVNKFNSYADDLGLALKASSIRIQAPIPGRGLVGIEIPNKHRDVIFLKEILLSDELKHNDNTLTIGLGKDISGRAVVADLAKMPHLLIAGATGSGKSVCINTIITSLLLRTTPDEVRMIMIDPKRVELAGYASIPHLWTDVVTDPEEALETFRWAVEEMERRYESLQALGVRDRKSYNKKVEKMNAKLESTDVNYKSKMPFIVIIVDEFADLIMTAGKEIELPIARLAQMARAVGMHIILATQRPSSKVITGNIKANFPARIAFQVSSRIDSRVILDEMGAEKLLGKGDMLFIPPGTSKLQRIHGAYVSDAEINNIVDYLETQPKPAFRMEKIVASSDEFDEEFDYDDELFPEAARMVVSSGMASVSMLQRSFKIGYARAGRLIDMLERANIVGPHKGSKSREVTATMEDLKVYGIEEF